VLKPFRRKPGPEPIIAGRLEHHIKSLVLVFSLIIPWHKLNPYLIKHPIPKPQTSGKNKGPHKKGHE
jgi:hypothetical protein